MLAWETPAKIDPSDNKKATWVNEAPSAEKKKTRGVSAVIKVLVYGQGELYVQCKLKTGFAGMEIKLNGRLLNNSKEVENS